MSASRSSFIAELFSDKRSDEEKSKRPPTLGFQFKKHLNDLVNTLKTCKPHYVRCIKPNDAKSPEFIDEARMIHQIQYLGIVENVKVRRAGFCYRETFEDFISRYRMLSKSTWPIYNLKADSNNNKIQAVNILSFANPTVWRHASSYQAIPVSENVDYKIGRSKLFIKDPTLVFLLEKNRAIALNALVSKIQAMCRGHPVYQRFKVIKKGFIHWQAEARRYIEVRRYKKKLIDIVRFQSMVRKFIQRCRFHKFVARFKNTPPRYWARKIQTRIRGYRERKHLLINDPEKYKKVQDSLQKIRDARIRWMSVIAIAKIFRGKAARKRYFIRKISWNRLRVSFYSIYIIILHIIIHIIIIAIIT